MRPLLGRVFWPLLPYTPAGEALARTTESGKKKLAQRWQRARRGEEEGQAKA